MALKQLLPFVTLLALAIPSHAAGNILTGFEYNMQSFNPNSNPNDGTDMGTGNCWTAASNSNNALVTLQPCVLGSAAQTWTFSAGTPLFNQANQTGGVGTITIFDNMCLDVTNGVDESGTKLQIFECFEGNTNQIWQATNEAIGIQTIQWAGTDKCIDLTGGTQTAGTPIQIWTCVGNTHQKWFSQFASTSPPEVDGFSVQFHNVHQKDTDPLLGITALQFGNNEPVTMAPTLNASLGINWVYQGGSLMTFDNSQCLDVTNGVDEDGTLLQTFSCVEGNTNQQWVFHSNHSIQWAGHDKCIDLTNGVLASGTRLQVWSCFDGNTNQQWRIDPVKTESQGFGDTE